MVVSVCTPLSFSLVSQVQISYLPANLIRKNGPVAVTYLPDHCLPLTFPYYGMLALWVGFNKKPTPISSPH